MTIVQILIFRVDNLSEKMGHKKSIQMSWKLIHVSFPLKAMKKNPATPEARRKVTDERWLHHLSNPGRPDRHNEDRDETLLNAWKESCGQCCCRGGRHQPGRAGHWVSAILPIRSCHWKTKKDKRKNNVNYFEYLWHTNVTIIQKLTISFIT